MNTKRKKTKAPTEAGAKSKKLALRDGGIHPDTASTICLCGWFAWNTTVAARRYFPYHLRL